LVGDCADEVIQNHDIDKGCHYEEYMTQFQNHAGIKSADQVHPLAPWSSGNGKKIIPQAGARYSVVGKVIAMMPPSQAGVQERVDKSVTGVPDEANAAPTPPRPRARSAPPAKWKANWMGADFDLDPEHIPKKTPLATPPKPDKSFPAQPTSQPGKPTSQPGKEEVKPVSASSRASSPKRTPNPSRASRSGSGASVASSSSAHQSQMDNYVPYYRRVSKSNSSAGGPQSDAGSAAGSAAFNFQPKVRAGSSTTASRSRSASGAASRTSGRAPS
jgi:hypothetical protein